MRKVFALALLATTLLTTTKAQDAVKIALFGTTAVQGAPVLKIRLPERFRVLTGQQFDLRAEATNLASTNATIKVFLDGNDITSTLSAPEVTTDNDSDPSGFDKAWTFRRLSIPSPNGKPNASPSVKTLQAIITDGGQTASATVRIGVQDFNLAANKSVILFLGDAMGTSYRDAGRIVAKSTNNRFREGFFDELQDMDQMPVTGMVMTYALDRIVPDSANTATAWSTGNKTIDGALGVFPDNDDFKFNPGNVQATKQFALNNPRIETFWEYLKRLYGYKTGIVTTADITDATPAGEGAHTITRSLGFDIASQYVDGVFTSGPTFDVVMGGGKERFISRTASNSGDARNLAAELQGQGYAYVQTRTELNGLPSGSSAPDKLLGLFRTGNMNVAYDKLGLTRPVDEGLPSFGGFNDQPFLDEMTAKAIATLNRSNHPFILMVEGASIDKQSHPNAAAGTIWDTIEFDKAIRVGRAFAAGRNDSKHSFDTLVLVTADHDQSMHIVGLTDTNALGAVTNTRSNSTYPIVGAPPPPASTSGLNNPGEVPGFPDYADANGDLYPENTNRFRIAVGFRTGNHTGSSVPITAEGAGALLFIGYFDQTDIFFKIARMLSSDTKHLDDALAEKSKLPIINQNY